MVRQGLLILAFILCFDSWARPEEIAEADELVRGRRYEEAAVYFNQYRRRFAGYEAYCTERTAYCLVQIGDLNRAIKLLREFDEKMTAPTTPGQMIERTRIRLLLSRLYLQDDEPKKALKVLEKCRVFANQGELNLHLLTVIQLRHELYGINRMAVRRKLLRAAIMSPPGTPGRQTLLDKFIEYGGDKSSITFENSAATDYSIAGTEKK